MVRKRLLKRTRQAKKDREAVLDWLEDLTDIRLAEAALEEIRAGRMKTIPLEQVMKDYGLEN